MAITQPTPTTGPRIQSTPTPAPEGKPKPREALQPPSPRVSTVQAGRYAAAARSAGKPSMVDFARGLRAGPALRPPGSVGPIPGERVPAAPVTGPTPVPTPSPPPSPAVPDTDRGGFFSRAKSKVLDLGGAGRKTGEFFKGLVPTEKDPWIKVEPKTAERVEKWTRRGFGWAPGGGTGIQVGEHIKAGTIFTPKAARDIGTAVGFDALFFAPLVGPAAAAGVRGVRTGAGLAPGVIGRNIRELGQMPIFSVQQARQLPGALWKSVRHPKEATTGFWRSDLMMPIRQPRETVRQLYRIGTGRTQISFTGGLGTSAATQTIPGPPPSAGPAPGTGAPPPPSPGAGPRFGRGGPPGPKGQPTGPRQDFSRFGYPRIPDVQSASYGGRYGGTEAFGREVGPVKFDPSQISNILGERTPLSSILTQRTGTGTALAEAVGVRPTSGVAVAETVVPARPTTPIRDVPWGPTRTTPGGPFQPGRPFRPKPRPTTQPQPEVVPEGEPYRPPKPSPLDTPTIPRVDPGVKPPGTVPQPSWPRPGPQVRRWPRTQPMGPFPIGDPARAPAISSDPEAERARTGGVPAPERGAKVDDKPEDEPKPTIRGEPDTVRMTGFLPEPWEAPAPIFWDDGYPGPPPQKFPPPDEPVPGEEPGPGNGVPGERGPGGGIVPGFPWLPGMPIGLGVGGSGGGAWGRATDPFGYQLRGEVVRQIDPFSGKVVGTRRVGPRQIRSGRAAVGSQRRVGNPQAQAGRMRLGR